MLTLLSTFFILNANANFSPNCVQKVGAITRQAAVAPAAHQQFLARLQGARALTIKAGTTGAKATAQALAKMRAEKAVLMAAENIATESAKIAQIFENVFGQHIKGLMKEEILNNTSKTSPIDLTKLGKSIYGRAIRNPTYMKMFQLKLMEQGFDREAAEAAGSLIKSYLSESKLAYLVSSAVSGTTSLKNLSAKALEDAMEAISKKITTASVSTAIRGTGLAASVFWKALYKKATRPIISAMPDTVTALCGTGSALAKRAVLSMTGSSLRNSMRSIPVIGIAFDILGFADRSEAKESEEVYAEDPYALFTSNLSAEDICSIAAQNTESGKALSETLEAITSLEESIQEESKVENIVGAPMCTNEGDLISSSAEISEIQDTSWLNERDTSTSPSMRNGSTERAIRGL